MLAVLLALFAGTLLCPGLSSAQQGAPVGGQFSQQVDFQSRYRELLDAISDYAFKANIFAPYQATPRPAITYVVGYQVLSGQREQTKLLVWMQVRAASAGSGTTGYEAAVRIVLQVSDSDGKVRVLGHDSLEVIQNGTAQHIASQRNENLVWFDQHRSLLQTAEQRQEFERQVKAYDKEVPDASGYEHPLGKPETMSIQSAALKGYLVDLVLTDRHGEILEAKATFYIPTTAVPMPEDCEVNSIIR